MKINKATDALLIVDVQNDFVTGSLAVPGAIEIIPVINNIIIIPRFGTVIYSVDSHIKDHPSFQAQGGPWPAHCVIGSFGHRLHKLMFSGNPIIVHKGLKEEAYSAFNGTVIAAGGPNIKAIEDFLYFHHIERLFICGLATDYCIKATVLDALKLFAGEIFVFTDAIRAVNINEGDGDQALREMEEAGAILTISNNLEN